MFFNMVGYWLTKYFVKSIESIQINIEEICKIDSCSRLSHFYWDLVIMQKDPSVMRGLFFAIDPIFDGYQIDSFI
jgi:ABC-type maltose transport system permease subunit